jgi:hypothetical protein
LESLTQILIVLIPGVVLAFVTSYVTVQLSIRQFREEKWWEKKEAAYSSMIDVVHRLKEYASHHYDRGIGKIRPSEEEKQKIEEGWKTSNAEYRRLRDLATFHVSPEAVDILHRYDERKNRARNESDDIIDWIEADLDASTECLKELIQEARRDLGAK